MGRLDGKVAIVTGAAPRGEGIGNGSAMATLMAREGAKVLDPEKVGGDVDAVMELIKTKGERTERMRR